MFSIRKLHGIYIIKYNMMYKLTCVHTNCLFYILQDDQIVHILFLIINRMYTYLYGIEI